MDNENYSPLRQLRKGSGMTIEKFAKQFSIEAKTQIAYESGVRHIPTDYATKVCDEYNVTFDWLFGYSKYKNNSDLMVNTILSLDKIFKVGYKTTSNSHNGHKHSELTLWMDKTFHEYLAEIRELQNARNITRQITDELYSASRRKIQEKYREYFQQLLKVTNCECGIDESKFINIETVDNGDFLNFLSY